MSNTQRLFGPSTVTEVFTADQISERVAELGRTLTEGYRDRLPVVVGVMKS